MLFQKFVLTVRNRRSPLKEKILMGRLHQQVTPTVLTAVFLKLNKCSYFLAIYCHLIYFIN